MFQVTIQVRKVLRASDFQQKPARGGERRVPRLRAVGGRTDAAERCCAFLRCGSSPRFLLQLRHFMSRSEPLLSNGTRKSVMKRRIAHDVVPGRSAVVPGRGANFHDLEPFAKASGCSAFGGGLRRAARFTIDHSGR